jgi:hypothetical protein
MLPTDDAETVLHAYARECLYPIDMLAQGPFNISLFSLGCSGLPTHLSSFNLLELLLAGSTQIRSLYFLKKRKRPLKRGSFGYKPPRRWVKIACKRKINGHPMSLAVQLSKSGRRLEPRVLPPP